MFHPAAANDLLLAILAFGLVLIPTIIIHELGHFFAARLVGINVLEFGIGFPPRVKRLFMWGETEFTLNLLPLGGFVRPLGEDMIGPAPGDKVKRDRVILEQRKSELARIVTEREMLQERGVDAKAMMSVNEAPALGRIFFMAAGAFANFISAVLLLILAALFGLSTNVGGLSQIADVPDGSLFAGSRAKAGDAIEKIDGQRFTDFSDFRDRLASHEGGEMDFALIDGETLDEYSLKLAPAFGEMSGLVQILAVAEDSPAEEAGLLAGDLVAEIEGLRIPSTPDPASDFVEAVERFQGRPLWLTILRAVDDGTLERQTVVVTPLADPPEGQGRLGVSVRSQISLGDQTRFANAGYKTERVPQSLPKAIRYGFFATADTFRLIASIPGQLLDGSLSGEDARPISIIGISKIGGELLERSLREGPSLMLQFTALISIFLGITNLLPIPALDGGRILFVLIEVLRGKPVNPATEAKIHQIGILLLLALGVVVMIYDLISPPSIT